MGGGEQLAQEGPTKAEKNAEIFGAQNVRLGEGDCCNPLGRVTAITHNELLFEQIFKSEVIYVFET